MDCPKGFQVVRLLSRTISTDGDGIPFIIDGVPLVGDGVPLVGDGVPLVVDGVPFVGDGIPLVENECPDGDCTYVREECPDGQCYVTSSCGTVGERPCYLGLDTCGECPIGTFNNETGSSACQPCPPGVNGIVGPTTTVRNGSVSVDDCILGKVS